MKVIVGLGNPGPKYRRTRHNVGFETLDRLADRLGVAFDREKYNALIAKGRFEGSTVVLVKPQTFMNLSGTSVARVARNAVDEPGELLVVADDVNLALGRLRLRGQGSAGGHNGLKSIIEHLGTDEFPRFRLGVGVGDPERDLSDHVLGSFTPEERPEVERMIERAVDGVVVCMRDGIAQAMNEFNAVD